MSLASHAVSEIKGAHEYFTRSSQLLTEEHANLTPAPGMMTTVQQIAHAAHTIDWFLEGAFRPEGFDLDFDKHTAAINAVSSMAAARAWFDRAFAAAIARIEPLSDADLLTLMAEGPIMGGEPRIGMIGAITDHTAHHRGALTVYTRLAGLVPPMPYMDM
ncbi:MAG: DinB family protein [Acidobacteria bacterium]|nr:DinB family protein [Acidobacteriota bacterium]